MLCFFFHYLILCVKKYNALLSLSIKIVFTFFIWSKLHTRLKIQQLFYLCIIFTFQLLLNYLNSHSSLLTNNYFINKCTSHPTIPSFYSFLKTCVHPFKHTTYFSNVAKIISIDEILAHNLDFMLYLFIELIYHMCIVETTLYML